MSQRHWLASVLASLLVLAACQSPSPVIPTPSPLPTVADLISTPYPTIPPLVPSSFPTASLSTSLLEADVTSMTPQVLSGTWQFWPSAYDPQAALDVVAGDNAIWVGTSFGVVRLDPQTRDYTTFKRLGLTDHILPIEDGKAFAANDAGIWYFDGHSWSRLEFSIRPYQYPPRWLDMFGVDVNGDFWLQWTISRGQPTLRFEGHVPPRDMPWSDINVDMSSKHAPLDCSWWRIFHSGSISYRSPEECQRLVKVHAVINQQQVYGPLAADTDGTFWRANDTTLYHLAADGSTLPQFPVSKTYRLAADPTHGVWLAAREGLFFSDGKTLQRVSIGLEKYTLYPTGSIVIDAAGTVWAASGRDLQQFDADTQRWSLVNDAQLSNMLNTANIEGFAAASGGGVWITTDRDLLRYDGKMITTMPLPEPRCGLRGLGVDPTGNVWFPSLNCGIVQFDPATKVWQHHQPSSNEFDVDVDHLSIGSDGSVYAAGVSGELWVYSPTARTWRFVAHIKKSINESESITADNHGGVWVTQSAEIRHYPDGFSFVLDPEVTGFRSYRIFADQRSNLWIATEDKLYLYDGKDLRLIASPPISPVGAMSAAPDGRLWFVGSRGIAVYDPKGNQP